MAEKLLTRAINTAAKINYISYAYANRSFLMAQKSEWSRALDDARMVNTVAFPPP